MSSLEGLFFIFLQIIFNNKSLIIQLSDRSQNKPMFTFAIVLFRIRSPPKSLLDSIEGALNPKPLLIRDCWLAMSLNAGLLIGSLINFSLLIRAHLFNWFTIYFRTPFRFFIWVLDSREAGFN
jgi:hypothetical protein